MRDAAPAIRAQHSLDVLTLNVAVTLKTHPAKHLSMVYCHHDIAAAEL